MRNGERRQIEENMQLTKGLMAHEAMEIMGMSKDSVLVSIKLAYSLGMLRGIRDGKRRARKETK